MTLDEKFAHLEVLHRQADDLKRQIRDAEADLGNKASGETLDPGESRLMPGVSVVYTNIKGDLYQTRHRNSVAVPQ